MTTATPAGGNVPPATLAEFIGYVSTLEEVGASHHVRVTVRNTGGHAFTYDVSRIGEAPRIGQPVTITLTRRDLP